MRAPTFWQSLSRTTRNAVALIAVLSTAAPTAYGAYLLVDEAVTMKEQVAANSEMLLALRFEKLNMKRLSVGLDPFEYKQFCDLGRKLGYFVNCPPARPNG